MIQLNIDPEVERRLIDAAAERGLDAAAYAGKIVADAVEHASPKRLASPDLEHFLDSIVMRRDQAPDLPAFAYTRQSFYEDHD
jgi:hypothetical protein